MTRYAELQVTSNFSFLRGASHAEELVVQVIPQADDEFTCYSCFLVRHRSQIAKQKDGHTYCTDCEG